MNAMMRTIGKLAVTCVVVVGLSTLCGCDLYVMNGFGGLGGYDPFAGYDPFGGYGGYTGGYTDWSYPDYGLYDPTNDIQSVIDYRQDVMDWSNDAWDAYIRQ